MPGSMLYVLTTEVVVSKEQLLKHALCASTPTTLKPDDFSYVDIDLLQGYLSQAIEQKHKGINILLYGEAGSGKTELAKVLEKLRHPAPAVHHHGAKFNGWQ